MDLGQNIVVRMQLVRLVSQILKNQEQNRYTAALFLDLSKAFDTLNHELLLNKLEIYGVRGIALDWFKKLLEWEEYEAQMPNW